MGAGKSQQEQWHPDHVGRTLSMQVLDERTQWFPKWPLLQVGYLWTVNLAACSTSSLSVTVS